MQEELNPQAAKAAASQDGDDSQDAQTQAQAPGGAAATLGATGSDDHNGDTGEAGDAAAAADDVVDAATALAAAEARVAELQDALMRAVAATENVRRRSAEDVAKAHKFAAEKFATELLPVKDSLEAALGNASQSFDDLRAGVELTLKQLTAAFDKSVVAEVNPVGDKFDPHLHQAISMVDSEQEANSVVMVLQKGYTLHGRVLRPAMVTVARGGDSNPETQD